MSPKDTNAPRPRPEDPATSEAPMSPVEAQANLGGQAGSSTAASGVFVGIERQIAPIPTNGC
jgi:hypothetical protein